MIATGNAGAGLDGPEWKIGNTLALLAVNVKFIITVVLSYRADSVFARPELADHEDVVSADRWFARSQPPPTSLQPHL